MVFTYFLGMCSYLAVSKKVSTAVGLGAAVIFVLAITMPLNWLLDQYLLQLSRTKTIGCNHKACVCIICDCFIIGVEKICWLSEENLIAKQSYLSVDFLEATTNKTIPTELRNQYKITGKDSLCNLLLSPRAHVKGEVYMSCLQSIVYSLIVHQYKYYINTMICSITYLKNV